MYRILLLILLPLLVLTACGPRFPREADLKEYTGFGGPVYSQFGDTQWEGMWTVSRQEVTGKITPVGFVIHRDQPPSQFSGGIISRSGDELLVEANGKEKRFALGTVVYVDNRGGIHALDESWPFDGTSRPGVEEAREFLERVSKRLYEAQIEDAAEKPQPMD